MDRDQLVAVPDDRFDLLVVRGGIEVQCRACMWHAQLPNRDYEPVAYSVSTALHMLAAHLGHTHEQNPPDPLAAAAAKINGACPECGWATRRERIDASAYGRTEYVQGRVYCPNADCQTGYL